jgi:hypothetical protein
MMVVITGLLFFGLSLKLGFQFAQMHHTSILFMPTIIAAFILVQIANVRRLLQIFFLIVLFFYCAALLDNYTPFAKMGDWKRVSNYIISRESPGEPILIFRAESALPFKIYYNGKNNPVPIPSDPNLKNYDLQSQVLRSADDVYIPLSGVISANRKFWLITCLPYPFRGVDFNYDILENFIIDNCSLLESKSFFHTEVKFLQLKKNK